MERLTLFYRTLKNLVSDLNDLDLPVSESIQILTSNRLQIKREEIYSKTLELGRHLQGLVNEYRLTDPLKYRQHFLDALNLLEEYSLPYSGNNSLEHIYIIDPDNEEEPVLHDELPEIDLEDGLMEEFIEENDEEGDEENNQTPLTDVRTETENAIENCTDPLEGQGIPSGEDQDAPAEVKDSGIELAPYGEDRFDSIYEESPPENFPPPEKEKKKQPNDFDIFFDKMSRGEEHSARNFGRLSLPFKILRKKIILAPLIIILILIAFISLIRLNIIKPGDIIKLTGAEDSPEVELLKIERKDINDELPVNGRISYYKKINLVSRVSGRIEKLYIKQGERVKRGGLLAVIDPSSLKQRLKEQLLQLDAGKKNYNHVKENYTRALKMTEIKVNAVERARTYFEKQKAACRELDRQLNIKTKLYEKGEIGLKEIEDLKTKRSQAHAKLQMAKADLEFQDAGFRDNDIKSEGRTVPAGSKERLNLLIQINTKVELAELKAAELRIKLAKKNIEAARALIKSSRIKSPFEGIIDSVRVKKGDRITGDSIIGTLFDISRVSILMSVSKNDIEKIKKGRRIKFSVDSMEGQDFEAEISGITLPETETRTIEVVARAENPEKSLVPGMEVDARIIYPVKTRAISVPLTSFISSNKNTGEIFLMKKGIALKHRVSIGRRYKHDAEILSGLKPGDVIVSAQTDLVEPGKKLTMTNWR